MAPIKTILAMALALSYTSATPVSKSKTHPRALGLQKRYNTIGFTELDKNGAGSPAFQHYFLPNDLDLTKRLFSAVAEDNDPTNSPYDFVIDCTEDPECTDDTFVLTDPNPEDGGPRTMSICTAFWKAEWADVTRLLPSDPDNEDQKTQWCDSETDALTNNYRQFVTAGHTLLHEVSHLDKVGAFLENDPDNGGGHGTFDYDTLDGNTQPNDALWQARQLQLLYVQAPDRTDILDDDGQRVTPIRNAESFAGSGTEAYFMMFCNVPYLSPQTGVGPDDATDDPDDEPEWKLPDPPAR